MQGAREWARDGYVISDDPDRLDRALVHRYLRDEAYWSPGVERGVVERSIDHSMVFGVYRAGEPGGEAAGGQVGFARVVSDRTKFAYLADVFVLPAERGRGLGKWLVATIMDHPELREVVWWFLATRDAHGLYGQFGFSPIPPGRVPELMERRRPRELPSEARTSERGGT
jgi:GNAT superfamily N-acetyltransferase